MRPINLPECYFVLDKAANHSRVEKNHKEKVKKSVAALKRRRRRRGAKKPESPPPLLLKEARRSHVCHICST
jgi:hypothetical protein